MNIHQTARKRGRPKAIRSLPAFAIRPYPDMGRREREHHRRHLAKRLNDTNAAAAENYWNVRIASPALEPYGIQLVPNDRVLHIFQEWPQQVRRKVSGSAWDGQKLIWHRPQADRPLCRYCSARWEPRSDGSQIWWLLADGHSACIHCRERKSPGKLTDGPKIRCAHRSWKSSKQMTATAREPVEPRGVDGAAAAALLAAIGHLATPLTKRARTYLDRGVNEQIMARRDSFKELPSQPWRRVMSGSSRPRIKLSDWWALDQRLSRISLIPTPKPLAEHLFEEPRTRGYPKIIAHHDAKAMDERLRRPGFRPWVSMPYWFIGPLSELVARLGIEEDLAELRGGEAWWANVGCTFFRDDPYADDPAADKKPPKTFLYRPGTAELQRPDVSRDEPFRAAARLWNWQINNRHREQMRIKWPKFASHGECCRVDKDSPGKFPDDAGGQCCRWTCGGFKTCPLQCWKRQK